jgi:hypothetical protein
MTVPSKLSTRLLSEAHTWIPKDSVTLPISSFNLANFSLSVISYNPSAVWPLQRLPVGEADDPRLAVALVLGLGLSELDIPGDASQRPVIFLISIPMASSPISSISFLLLARAPISSPSFSLRRSLSPSFMRLPSGTPTAAPALFALLRKQSSMVLSVFSMLASNSSSESGSYTSNAFTKTTSSYASSISIHVSSGVIHPSSL